MLERERQTDRQTERKRERESDNKQRDLLICKIKSTFLLSHISLLFLAHRNR